MAAINVRIRSPLDLPRAVCFNVDMDPCRVYDYLTRARSNVFDWVRPLTPARYRQVHPIGLGSLARTLHHVKAAEWSYMERIRGRTEPLGAQPASNDPEVTEAEALAFPQLEQAWIDQAAQTRTDLASVTDWSTPHVYTTVWDGEPYSYRASRADLFSQLALHEIHHRAQVLHMLRRLGVATGDIDYNALMWTRSDRS